MGGGDKRKTLQYMIYTTIHVGMAESHLCVYFIESDVAMSYFVMGILWVHCPHGNF